MRHVTITEEYQEFAALYALGALSQHEARAFEDHLRGGCAACEAEVAEFDKVVTALGYGEAPVATPTYLRDILMGRIEREAKTKEGGQSATVVQLSNRRAARQGKAMAATAAMPAYSFVPWAIAASFAIFSIISFVAWRQIDRSADELREQMTTLRYEVGSNTDQLKAKISELSQINEALGEALSTEGVRVISLAGNQEVAPSASAKVYWNTQQNKWIVSANLPPPEAGKVYQLWFITADAKVNAGRLKPDPEGRAFTVVDVPSNIGQITHAGITLEPEGGSDQPTSPLYASGTVKS